MVMHVRDLNGVGSQQETPPSSYVKVYLLPDPQKHTKRKTRVVKRNANPTFMEMVCLCETIVLTLFPPYEKKKNKKKKKKQDPK